MDVEIAPASGVPLTVVREAKRRKNLAARNSKREGDSYLKYDSVWCVFDVDDHPHVPEALQMASQTEIKVALSNPCFELWLMLHLRDAPGMVHRDRAQKMLKTLVPGYDKKVDFEVYQAGYGRAVDRARKLDELAESVGEPGKNPTSGVYKLTESIAPPPVASSGRKSAP